MEYSVSRNDLFYQLNIGGQFTFNDNRKFRDLIAQLCHSRAKAITVNVGGVDFIDSAGLGMLLLLNDECGKHGKKLALTDVRGQVKKMVQLSSFDKLFRVVYIDE